MKLQKYGVTMNYASRRGPCVYAIDGNTIAPICYLRRPKWLHPDAFQEIVQSIRLGLSASYSEKELRTAK